MTLPPPAGSVVIPVLPPVTLISTYAGSSYWEYPLRQVQRDDGLGRSVMRARGGTSVQTSIRQRGYR